IGIRQSQIGVKEHDILAGARELDREIDGDVALAHAAFTARDCNDAGARFLARQVAKLRCLIHHHRHAVLPRILCARRRPCPTSMSSGTFCPVVTYDRALFTFFTTFSTMPTWAASSNFVKMILSTRTSSNFAIASST